MPANGEAHYAPDLSFDQVLDSKRRQVGVVEGEARDVALDDEALQAHGAIDDRHHNAAVAGLEAAVGDCQIPVEDAGPAHAVAGDVPGESGGWVRRKPARQLQRTFQEVVGWRWEARAECGPLDRDADRAGAVWRKLRNLEQLHRS
jgi:hypothetical protein